MFFENYINNSEKIHVYKQIKYSYQNNVVTVS